MRNLSQWSSQDRDEWLSAYIDNELSPHDRQVVEQWLAQDPQYQACYQRLLRMRQGFEELRSQELANLPHLSPQSVLTEIPWVSSPLPWGYSSKPYASKPYGSKHRSVWQSRLKIAFAGVGGLSLALLWSLGLRQPWAEPVAQAPTSHQASISSASPQASTSPHATIAIVPSPSHEVATQSILLERSSPSTASLPSTASSTHLVSTHKVSAEPGLTFALDQPFLALPPEESEQ